MSVSPEQSIEIVRHLGFCMGNVAKHVLRASSRNGAEDLRKARAYLELEAETPGPGVRPDFFRIDEPLKTLRDHLTSSDDQFAHLQAEFLVSLERWLLFRQKNADPAVPISVMRKLLDIMADRLQAGEK